MKQLRPSVLIIVIVAVAVLVALFSHGIRVRLIWGASGFVAGLIFGVLLTIEVRHRVKRRREARQSQ